MKRNKSKPSLKSKKTSQLTPDQLRQLFFAKCKDREHLYEWIRLFWGVNLPKTIVSRYSNCSPLDSVWEIYKACVWDKKGLDVLYIAPRGGGKTLGVAITESALMFHDRRGAVHIGAIEKQAKRAYSYFQTFLQKNKEILSSLVEKSVIEKTTLIIDNEPVTLECLPCTMSSLNGPHEACCVMDELDTLSPEGLSAYKQINGIPVRHRLTGAPPVKIGISTRKSAYGLVQRQMDTAVAQGRSIKIWNQIDMTERCEKSRHGTGEVTLFVDQMRMHHVPQEEFDKLTEDKRKDYIAYQATNGCVKCPLFSVCLGDLKNQDPEMTAEKSTMITCIDDLIIRIKGADTDWVLAELMCLKPSTEGLVFKEFEKSRHVVGWNKMWEKLTKEKPTEEIDEVKFLQEIHKRKLPIYGGIDWGWSAPSTFIAVAVDEDDNTYVLRAFGLTKTNDPTFIHLVKTKYHRLYRIQMYYPDVANGSAVDLMKTAGLPVASKIDKSENLGVQVIKRLLNTPGTSEVKLFISEENCQMMVHEFERYHYEKDGAGETIDGRFAKEFDHCFIPGTLINTINGVKSIETIIEGDLVLSHDGLYHAVEGITNRDYNGEVVTIRPKGNLPFTCTPEHPILSQRFDRFTGQEGIRQLTGQLRPIGDTEWILAGDLSHSPRYKSQVRVLTPIIKEVNSIRYVYDQLKFFPNWIEVDNLVHPARITKIGKQVQSPTGFWSPRFAEVDEDFAFFLGWYVAEGSTSKKSGQVTLACHNNEITIIPLMNRIAKKLNFTFNLFKPTNSINGMCFSINSSFLRAVLSELGVGNTKKYPDWLLTQSRSIVTSFLGGYLFGDGCFTDGKASCNSISPNLIQNTYLAMIKLGYKASMKPIPKREGQFQYGCCISCADTNLFIDELFKINDFKDIFNGKKVLRLIPEAVSGSTFLSNDHLFRSINYVTSSKYEGKVYNLHVKDTNTYCVNGIVVHNCIDPLRYILTAVMGKSRFIISHDGVSVDIDRPLRTEDGSYYRAPSFHELAMENSIQIAPQESRPFNRGDNEEEEDPGGMLWSF